MLSLKYCWDNMELANVCCMRRCLPMWQDQVLAGRGSLGWATSRAQTRGDGVSSRAATKLPEEAEAKRAAAVQRVALRAFQPHLSQSKSPHHLGTTPGAPPASSAAALYAISYQDTLSRKTWKIWAIPKSPGLFLPD